MKPNLPKPKCLVANKFVALQIIMGIQTQDRRPIVNSAGDVASYSPGDILWLREPAKIVFIHEGSFISKYLADDEYSEDVCIPERCQCRSWVKENTGIPNGCIKEFCRCWLYVTAARAEKLQEISDADVRAEGCRSKASFLEYWDTIYEKSEFCASANPLVWVTSFKRTEKPEGWLSYEN